MNQTTSGANIEQRSIVIMPFPYTDQSKTKERPCLVLSRNELIGKQRDMIACAITSQNKNFGEAIKITNSHMNEGHLKKDSWVIANKIMTLERGDVIKSIGKLNIEKSKETVEKLDEDIKIEE